MPTHDYVEQLETVVESILVENDMEMFAVYWKLGKELIEGLPVRAFYTRTEGSHANLAILTDKLVVDIEKNDDDQNPGGIGIGVIKSIATVYFRAGPVQTIPNSETSQLTVFTLMIGAAEAGPYWIAKTDSERENLTRFGKALLNAVNAS